ncbi:MAG: tyrosine-type recombinase/integrase [Xanthobacteraceae bacterium]
MRTETSGRKRKAPKNTEWRGDTLHGRIRIKGKLSRWSLRTDDVELAKQLVAEDIARMKAAAFHGDQRVRYEDMAAAWGERHILHEVGARTAHRYAVSLAQIEPFLIECFLDEIDRDKISQIVEARRAKGVKTATIRRDLTALASVLDYAEVENNPARARLVKLKERRDPIVLPEPPHIERVISRAPAAIAPLIRLAWSTGCRLEELTTAEHGRVDKVRKQLTVVGKGNKLRVIELGAAGYEIVRALTPRIGCKWLFWQDVTGADGKTTFSPLRDVSSRFAKVVKAEMRGAVKAAKAAGHDQADFRPFRLHDLRHRHAVDFLQAGGSIYDLQLRLGHTSVMTTEIYLKFLTPEEARAAKYGVAKGVAAPAVSNGEAS